MASDWEEVNLGDLFEQSNQGVNTTTEKVEYSDDGLIVIRAKNISAYSIDYQDVVHVSEETFDKLKSAVKPKCGDILFTNIGSQLGSAALVKNNSNFIIAWNVFRIVPNLCKVNAKFLESFLNSEETGNLVRGLNASSTMPFISGKVLRGIKLNLPPLPEQKAIAHILGSLDDKIELNRQMNETLEAMAQALFKSWFVDFDPVIDNALAAGNAIPDAFAKRAEQRKGIEKKDNADIQGLFPDEFEFTEEMGWIPKGWEVENLDKKIDVLNGFAFKSKDYVEKGLFVLRTKNFTSERSVEILGDDVYLPNEFENTFSKYLSEPFDYHLVMVGASVGNRGLIEPHQLPALRNQNMWCFRPKPNAQISRSYVKYMLDFVTPQKLGLASGSAREFFRKGDFQKHQLCLPSNATLNKFDQIAFSYLKKKAQNNSENVSLSKLRDTLLPKLMSGELRIADAVALVDEAI